MYEECKKMILEVKESLENENEDLAREIALQDDKIDSLYNRVQEDCLRVMNDESSDYKSRCKSFIYRKIS